MSLFWEKTTVIFWIWHYYVCTSEWNYGTQFFGIEAFMPHLFWLVLSVIRGLKLYEACVQYSIARVVNFSSYFEHKLETNYSILWCI